MKQRDNIVDFCEHIANESHLNRQWLVDLIGIRQDRYYAWKRRYGKPNVDNSQVPKAHWLLPEERQAIIDYARETIAAGTKYTKEGYRRLTYQMIDKDICYCKPATVYKVLKETGLLNKWKGNKTVTKGTGFKQPKAPHEQWHMDIKYVNYNGGFIYFISVLDGFSRAILNFDLRPEMTEKDVQIVLQKAYELYPEAKGKTKLISDNGKQFLAKDFSNYLKTLKIRHIRTSPMYPQSNGKLERFHRTLNEECIQKNSFIDNKDIKEQFEEFVNTYNNKRLHSAIGYLPPITYLNGTYKEKLEERKKKLEKAAEKRKIKNRLLAA